MQTRRRRRQLRGSDGNGGGGIIRDKANAFLEDCGANLNLGIGTRLLHF
jgi:hypothetical protein